MKKVFLPILLAFASYASMAQHMKYNIITDGFDFSPDSITVMPKDTVIFTIGGTHDLTQVDSSTWAKNGATPIPNAFFIEGGATDTLIFDTTGVFYYVCSIHANGGMKGKIVIEEDITTSLPVNLASTNGIRIFPNPVQSNVHVQFPQATQVQSISVVNTQGTEVLNQSVQSSISSHNLNVENLEKGIYQVVISAPDKRYVSKIVVQ